LDETQFPRVNAPTHIVGQLTPVAATEYGLSASVPVIVGSGDGFLANVGSDCEVPNRIAVTLGTSAVVRQTVNRAITDVSAGTFCYRADASRFLFGCAGSNGGNVLDWGRRIFGKLEIENSTDPPIFIPLLHGERSPDWDPHRTGSWHGLTARHTASDLSRSVLEGVIFNLAHFIDIVQTASAETATDLVLSGNGFLHPSAAPMLAAVAGVNTWTPRAPGLASLRGAGICALRALGQTAPVLELIQVLPLGDLNISKRYGEYRKLRSRQS
jgi:gluconokinase